MEARENARLNELKLVFNLRDIDKTTDNLAFKNCMTILNCIALALGREQSNRLYEIIRKSFATNFLGASDKELIAVCKTFYKPTVAAKKLGYSYPYYTTKYGDLLSRNYITDEWLDSLQPVFPDDIELIRIVNDFIDNFNFTVGSRTSAVENKLRTYELEFWIIMNKLSSIYQNDIFVDKILLNICNAFGLDYNSILYLRNNIHRITRSFPILKYNMQYFMQELINMCYAKGIKRGTIGNEILGKDTHYLYNNKKVVTENIVGTDLFDCIYVPTLDWTDIDKISVNRFISIFYDFIEYAHNTQ